MFILGLLILFFPDINISPFSKPCIPALIISKRLIFSGDTPILIERIKDSCSMRASFKSWISYSTQPRGSSKTKNTSRNFVLFS